MAEEKIYDEYDAFAGIYNRHWGPMYGSGALPILRKMLGERLRPGILILDLCCGSGHISQHLVENGQKVIGVDGSSALLDYARVNAPSVTFHRADARNFSLDAECDGAICLSDSLNHILNAEGLTQAFGCVFKSLHPGGWFLFDLNLEEKYRSWKWSHSIVEKDAVCVISADADLPGKRAYFHAIVFRRRDGDAWVRQDANLQQTWYSVDTVRELLSFAGFVDIKCMTGDGRDGVSAEAGKGYFLGVKPVSE